MAARVEVLSPDLQAIGDWNAPEGSEPWARALRVGLQRCVDKVGMYPDQMKALVDKAIKHAAWTKLLDAAGKTFPTFEAFCATRQPYGLGTPYDALKPYLLAAHGGDTTMLAALTTRPEAAPKAGGKRKGAGRKAERVAVNEAPAENQGSHAYADSEHVEQERGSDYLAARIARDAPEVLEDMKAGKFKSVRAAAKAAGIVKEPNPLKVAARAIAAVPTYRLAEMVALLSPELRTMLFASLKDQVS